MSSRAVHRGYVALVIAALAVANLRAQDAPRPSFDVTSVKFNKTTGLPSFRMYPNGRLEVRNFALRPLVQRAWNLPGHELLGGEDWTATERFDVAAVTDRAVPTGAEFQQTMRLMLQSLLTDRFGLRVHFETREMSIYVLVLARSDSRWGPQLSKAGPCTTRGDSTSTSPPGGARFCGFSSTSERVISAASASEHEMRVMRFTSLPVSQIAASIQNEVRRQVIDRTGIAGNVDADLSFQPEATGLIPSPDLSGGPSLFTAVQAQLGLKLDSQKGDVTVLVIDDAKRPRTLR